jgi:filamentous hemagglutinin family protein
MEQPMTQQIFAAVAPARSTRKALFLSCAAIAIAGAAVAPECARAQAFNGTISSSSNATRTSVGPGSETITVSGPTATINWAPNESGSGTIDFLPSSSTATFTSESGIADYTVLNRIVPTDASRGISLNGTIQSFIEGSGSTGGNIWFYSPGGIVVGATAVVDVGGLLLTTGDVLRGWSADANGFSASFSAPAGSASAIQVLGGAQINALQKNSYVAMVAPRIEQGGNVQVAGSAAYVAGEQVTLTMNQGLFDIQVDAGTTDQNGIVHTGTTGGPASADETADPRRVYMVAIPKNQALTMLLGGNIGFEATSANLVSGQIVLSAGSSINDTGSGYKTGPSGTGDAGIDLGPGTYSSSVWGIARGDIAAIADSGAISFAGDVDVGTFDAAGTGNVSFQASNENSLTIGGDLDMISSNPGSFSELFVGADTGGSTGIAGNLTMAGTAAEGSGADAAILANGGTISVGGLASINVDGLFSAAATPNSAASDGSGGQIDIRAFNEGRITAGALQLSANGTGQDGSGGASATAGTGFGGSISVNADSGGAIHIGGDVDAAANGSGGDMLATATAAGAGLGGSATINAGNGAVTVAGDVTLNAGGAGGTVGEGNSGGTGGSGFGGTAGIVSYGPGSITVSGDTSLVANATGGDGQTGGDAYGGNAGVFAIDGTVSLGTIDAAARATGGSASFGFGGNGGFAQGGLASIEADAEVGNIEVAPSIGTIRGGDVTLDATGVGGSGGAGDGEGIAAGAGGIATGGFFNGELRGGAYALAQSDGAVLDLGNVTAIADGFGGAGGTGGTGQAGGAGGTGFGGLAQAGEYDPNGFNQTLASATFGDLDLSANGHGGAGGSGPAGDGIGGDGFGGFAVINARGTVDAGSSILAAAGFGGDGGTGGASGGGDLFIQAFPDSALTLTGDVSMDGSATGGDGSSGSGGDAFGGYTEASTTGDGATLTISGLSSLATNASGGSGASSGGSGFAGSVYFRATGASSASTGSLHGDSNGTAGTGASSDGSASGGSVYVLADSTATVDIGDAVLNALGPDGFVSLNWSDPIVAEAVEPLAVQAPGIVYGAAITANSGGDIAVGDVSASGLVDLTAAATANFYGVLSAPLITVTSSDINIPLGGSLGVQGVTDLITLNATSDSIFIGGDEDESESGEYHLAEAGDIASGALIINAAGTGQSGPPDIHVLDLRIEGSQTFGRGVGAITMNSDGSILVEGLVDFINAGAADSLTLNAGQTIEIITDTGGISITDSDGVLSGTLALNAPNIWAASQSIIDQLEVDPDFAGRVDALRTNGGPVKPEGYVRAGSITAEVGNTFYVQNSGTLDEFAGLTAGDGGLTIVSSAGASQAGITAAAANEADVDIYGRQEKSDGTLVLNDDFAAEVPVSGPFTSRSTINDCPLGGCPPPPPPPGPPASPPALGPEAILGPVFLMSSPRLSELILNPLSNSDSGLESDLIDTGPVTDDEDIEEPVTSGGDSPTKPK